MSEEEKEFDIWGTDTVICPYCGHDHGNDELHNIDQYQCEECNKTFGVEVDYTVDYTTRKLPCANGDAEHELRQYIREGKFSFCRKCGKGNIGL